MIWHNRPERPEWDEILRRPVMSNSSIEPLVADVLRAVKEDGDAALRKFTLAFDNIDLPAWEIPAAKWAEAENSVPVELRQAILAAAANIEKFHRSQQRVEEVVETSPGVQCWRRSVPIGRIGLYIPGGTAPLFSTILMLGLPAAIAGCCDIILCTPPARDGSLHPAILFAARLAGITRIFRVGGAQAIAAMAYGTESIPRVDKIFGPGNQYVTCAKQLVQKDGVGIDMPAGPSELAVFADETADPTFVAADLLSQAEHGADSQVLLVSENKEFAQAVESALEKQLAALPRRDLARSALAHSRIMLVRDRKEALDILNAYAPEHLILACRDARSMAEQVVNAGSVFLGNYSPESAGDYASGTNHVLPTNGYARSHSGVSLDSFVKKITFQELSTAGITQLGETIERLAAAEGLEAHARAVRVRLDALNLNDSGK